MVILNGSPVQEPQNTIPAWNRSFHFGDGLFETIRVIEGKPVFLEDHLQRLAKGTEVLGIEYPGDLTLTGTENMIQRILNDENVMGGARIRLTVFREEGGAYSPTSNKGGYLIELKELENDRFTLNENGWSVGIYKDIPKDKGLLSPFKTNNALPYILASKWASNNGFSDALLINGKGHIVEATSSNVFLVIDGALYTPPVTEGCVGGIMRKQVINVALEKGVNVYESILEPQHLLDSDEIFLTNAVNGIRWIGSFRNKRFYNNFAKNLTLALTEKVLNSRRGPQGN